MGYIMKKIEKKFGIFAVIFLLAIPAFSQTLTIEDLQSGVEQFSQSMASPLQFNSTLGLNWSDAYIGQLFALPPHFGVGVSAGFTSIPLDALSGMMSFVMPGNDPDSGIKDLLDGVMPEELASYISFPFPSYTLEARLGGFGASFDIGAKYSFFEPQVISEQIDKFLPGIIPIDFNYMLAGADIRFALFNPKAVPIKLSIGIGFNYLKGGISTKLNDTLTYYFDANGSNNSLTVTNPEVDLIWETKTIEAKAQLSFPLLVVTPYVGIGASYGWSEIGYSITEKVYVNGAAIENQYIDVLMDEGLDITPRGFSSIMDVNGINLRAFGGISINLFVIMFDATVLYNISDKSLGAQVGIRFQL